MWPAKCSPLIGEKTKRMNHECLLEPSFFPTSVLVHLVNVTPFGRMFFTCCAIGGKFDGGSMITQSLPLSSSRMAVGTVDGGGPIDLGVTFRLSGASAGVGLNGVDILRTSDVNGFVDVVEATVRVTALRTASA